MKAVVDTNVVAYFVLRTRPFADEATDFWQITDSVYAPSVWEAEYANIIWMAVRSKLIEQDEAPGRLRIASPANRSSLHTLLQSAMCGLAARHP